MSQGRILLVEDDEIIALLIEDALADVGHEVVTHVDGQAAWEHLQAGDTAFDAILTDRNMPRMDGLALLRKLKETPALHDIPVIMETGETRPASIQEGIDQGAHYYLTKPFKPDVLVATSMPRSSSIATIASCRTPYAAPSVHSPSCTTAPSASTPWRKAACSPTFSRRRRRTRKSWSSVSRNC
ncbi:MAG: response regulator [Pseudomonadota bacterium]|nr:response regulator [Pseudomonadota bacterium]MDP2351319.1 response regulator [Pseudomonadota bacterium]